MLRRRGRGRLLLLVFIALSILVITLDYQGASGPLEGVKDFSQAVLAPIQRGLSSVTRPVGNFFSSIGELADLREENEDLNAEVGALRAEVEQARELTDENVELRDHLELDEPWFAQDRVAAQVIADAPGNFRWAVIIDKGKANGLKTDMAVVNPDGLVGKIVQADSHQATVLLLVDPKLGAAAAAGEEGVEGLVSGNGGGRDLSLELIAKGEDLEPADRVITSNFNQGIYPRGIPIGEISEIGGDVRAGELQVRVDPYVDFGDLNFLTVLLETGRQIRVGESG
jgi:rod shape-determining protein MreC